MNKLKIVGSYIIGFLETCIIVILVLLLVSKFTINNKNYLYHCLQENNYYEKVYLEIQEEMQNALMSTGFTESILNNLFTKEEVINDIHTFIENTYNGKVTLLDKSNIQKKLDKNIDEFLKSSNLDLLNKDDLLSFEQEIVDIYKNEITLYGMINSVIPKYPKLNKYIDRLLIIVGILFIGLMVILRRNRVFTKGALLVASGLIILFIKLAIYERIDMDNIILITENFSYLIRSTLNYINMLLLIIGLVLTFLGICQIMIRSLFKKEKSTCKVMRNGI